jgi:hypothetical protein
MLQGAVPYAEIADIKPPLAFVAFFPAGLFHGVYIFPVHVLGVFWMLATCLVGRAAAPRLTGSELAGWCAAWLAVLAAQCDVPSVSTELLIALPAAGALFFFVRAASGGGWVDSIVAGICIGIAALIRQQAGILLAAFGIAFAWRAFADRRASPLLHLAAITAGFALPLALTLGLFGAAGRLPELWDWVIARNLKYAAGGAWTDTFLRAAVAIPLCVAAAFVPWVLAVRETLLPAPAEQGSGWAVPRGTARLGVVLAVWLSWIAVCAGGRFYEHYFLHFVPPLALLAAPQALVLVRAWPFWTGRARAWAVVACTLPAAILLAYSFARGIAGMYPEQEPKARHLAAWLRQNTAPEERLFIWGHYSPIYYLAQRLPGTRYVTTSVHVGNFDPGQLADGIDLTRFRSDRDVSFTLHDLEANRVPVFVDTTASGIHHWDRIPLSAVPALEHYVQTQYRLVAEVDGSRVYRRRDTTGVAAAEP